MPSSSNVSARARALATVRSAYSSNSGFQRLFEADGLAGDVVHQGAALRAGEDGLVDGVGVLLGSHDDAAAARADGLVRRPRHEVRNADRRGVDARGDETGDVGDVREVVGAHIVRDLLNRLPLHDARVRGVPGDDDVRFELLGLVREGLVVDVAGVGVDVVLLDLVRLAREVRRVAVT